MSPADPSVVIVGAGPAGCALATLLAKRGVGVTVFDDAKRPDLLVGESLVPGVIPVLRELGVEERVAGFSQFKPGASFYHTDGEKVHFNFKTVSRQLPGYAYNVPRPQFDNLLRIRAEEVGARFVKERAQVEALDTPSGKSIRLTPESQAAIGLNQGSQPFLVDATGRARLFSRALDLKATRGKRDDAAYFAHFENFQHDDVPEGQIIISVLRAGWSWRIPLKDRLSVGIVINKEHAKTLGATAEERLERAIREEPLLRDRAKKARRVSEVMTYTNYQLLSDRGSGPGWALVGDAFGFVDPMLSPGLFMSLKSAEALDRTLQANTPAAWTSYEQDFREWHAAWGNVVNYFYNGKIFQADMGRRGLIERHPCETSIARRTERHVTFHLSSMLCGGNTRHWYSRNLVRLLMYYSQFGLPPTSDFEVQDQIRAA